MLSSIENTLQSQMYYDSGVHIHATPFPPSPGLPRYNASYSNKTDKLRVRPNLSA